VRSREREKRGGGALRVTLKDVADGVGRDADLLALDAALMRLEAVDPQKARVVELRYFAGLSIEETAEALGISPTTVKREWRRARAFLHRELEKG